MIHGDMAEASGFPPSSGGDPLRVLVVDDEANITDLVGTALRYEGFEVAGRRPTAATALRRRPAFRPRPDRARRHAPRPRRLRGASGGSGATACAVPVVFLTARDATEDKVDGPHPRRRRLRHQAVQPRGAGRPGAGRAAPDARRATTDVGRLRFADLELDEDTHEVWRGGEPIAAHRHRVQAAALPDAQPPPGAVEGPDPRPRLAVRLRRRRQRRRDLHQLPAQEDRPRRSRG